ncbi:MAG: transcriptional repressor [Bacteroidota bacterium]
MGTVRKTKSVKALLDVFSKKGEAVPVCDLISTLGSQMNRTTIYRILQRLEKEGTLHSFTDKDGQRCYAKHEVCSSTKEVHSHPHFQCKECGKIICLSIDVSLPKIGGHRVEAAELLLIGQCETCVGKD